LRGWRHMNSKADTKTMNQEKKYEVKPKLRFPEFWDAGGWEKKRLGQIGDILMCKRIFAEETNNAEGVPFFKIGTLGRKPDAFISKKIFDEYKSKYNFPRKGEILITCSGTVGKCLLYDGDEAYYQDSNIVWIDNPTLEISNDFLHNVLLEVNWGTLNSTTITRIYGSDLRNLLIIFPANQSEQKKIADCLSSIDDRITAETQKLSTLKVHKKGLMQQLFPAEGETVPDRRFPEFLDSGEWEEKRLSELTTYVDYRGKSPIKYENGIFLVTAKNIKKGYIDYKISKEYVSPNEYEEVMKRGKPRIGDILLTTEAPLGNVAQVDNENIALAQRIIKFRCNTFSYNNFLKHYMLGDRFQRLLQSKAIGSTVLGIQGKVLHQLPLNIPSKSEQQKIANCLSSLDELITAQTKKIHTLKTHKKGLMQQLFPAVEDAIE
jgi:type I restriction enzyme S subunit